MFPIYDGESLDTMQIEKCTINTVMCEFLQWFPVHQSWEIGHKFNFFRITGLDPAAPLYLKWSYDAIRKTDAPFVDLIHTNGERLGESWAR